MLDGINGNVTIDKVEAPLHVADLERFDLSIRELQGNILKGHGRDHTAFLILKFKPSQQPAVRRWLHRLESEVTSTSEQLDMAKDRLKARAVGATFSSVLLSASCYRYLELPLTGFSMEFLGGMKAAQVSLGDPLPQAWEPGYQGEIHALVMLADSDLDRLKTATSARKTELVEIAEILATEFGKAIRDKSDPKTTFEHFGYADGISQPVFIADTVAEIQQKQGIDKWDPSSGPNLVLVLDPLGQSPNAFGSYVVFRKLEQNVQAFVKAKNSLAVSLDPPDPKIAGALAIGRFEDGTPIAGGRLPNAGGRSTNNFNFNDDLKGDFCPFHAHIRKVNPRGTGQGEVNFEAKHRIARRGIPYGEKVDLAGDVETLPTAGRGLLFVCYQRSIRNQFEFLQAQWGNKRDFPVSEAGIDPIIGQVSQSVAQRWPQKFATLASPRTEFAMQNFVTLKGGEYFFAPSRSFLRTL